MVTGTHSITHTRCLLNVALLSALRRQHHVYSTISGEHRGFEKEQVSVDRKWAECSLQCGAEDGDEDGLRVCLLEIVVRSNEPIRSRVQSPEETYEGSDGIPSSSHFLFQGTTKIILILNKDKGNKTALLWKKNNFILSSTVEFRACSILDKKKGNHDYFTFKLSMMCVWARWLMSPAFLDIVMKK